MEWNRGPIIGRGSSAVVSVATTASGEVIAVKSTELSSSSLLQREQTILSKINSPHIIKYLGSDTSCENNKHLYNILMEYLSGGTLSDVIKKQGGSLDESMIRVYSNQVVQGLSYLHSNNIVHCDIKGQNILVGRDGVSVKIGDLGCAKLLEKGVCATSGFAGTPVFLAPEVARGQEQGFPADIWALGCTIIEMATGSNPWPESDDPFSAIHKIGFSGDLPDFPKWLSDDAKDFLNKCLNRDAKQRWTAKQLVHHQFLLPCDYHNISPTSVLELGFWDSMVVPGPTSNPTRSGDCPDERIRRLIASTVLPEWRDDQDWLAVRINASQQNWDEIEFINNDNVRSSNTQVIVSPTSIFHQQINHNILVFRVNITYFFSSSIYILLRIIALIKTNCNNTHEKSPILIYLLNILKQRSCFSIGGKKILYYSISCEKLEFFFILSKIKITLDKSDISCYCNLTKLPKAVAEPVFGHREAYLMWQI